MRIALVLTFLALVAGPVVGCGGAPDMTEVKPGPPVPGLNLSGKWYSTEFGDMRLVQDDRRVTGTYEDPRGPDHNGRIEARIEGDVLWVEWIKPGNPVAAVFPLRGRAWLRIGDAGKKLTGEWGYEDNHSNGGEWEAEKSQFQ